MTIICVKDGVIAADGACWFGNIKAEMGKPKIVRSRDGALGASVGDASYTESFRMWFAMTDAREHRELFLPPGSPMIVNDDKREFAAVWVEPDGDMSVMESDGRPYFVGRGPHAIGAAREMAFGAMYAGASAEEAVRICVERHDGAGGEVFVERLAPVEAPPEDVDARPAETFGTDRVAEPVRENRAATAEWKERAGLA